VPAPPLLTHEVVERVVPRLHSGSLEAPFGAARPSAVLVLLADGPDGAEVLLTRRAMHLRNHRGEVSFPGGRLDPGEDYVEAALREAEEEVGLPRSTAEVVGVMQPLSTLVSLSWIVPVLARIAEPVELHGHPGEVDRVLWVPLRELTLPGTYREEVWTRTDDEFGIVFFELDDETVWGATARMLSHLLRVAHGVESIEEPGPPAR
jgi:8-oxo-dGTP pyrophosphatase MutT (NUDIX family)